MTGTLHLSVPVRVTGACVHIFNVAGALIGSVVLEQPGTEAAIDVTGLQTGLYFLRIQQPDGTPTTLSFLKE